MFAAAVAALAVGEGPTTSLLEPSYGQEHWPLSTTAKVFHIGANKAGTTSMWLYYTDLPGKGWSPCHDLCQPGDIPWYTASHNHNEDAPWIKKGRSFFDNGDQADYEWLYQTFAGSRYVLNLRKLRDWLVSRYDMVREIRVAGGCTPNGTHASCKFGFYQECAPQAIFNTPSGWKKCLRSKLTWTGNSADEMQKWVYGLSKRQSDQYWFFTQSEERMNRFVMADFTDPAVEEDGLRRLAWINRADLDKHRTQKVLDMHHQLPDSVPPLSELPGPKSIPHMLPDGHPGSSEEWITRLLGEWGCEGQAEDRLYIDCGRNMHHKATPAKRLMLEDPADAPAEEAYYPSATYWRQHNFTLEGLPPHMEVVDVQDADDGEHAAKLQ